MFFDSIEDLPRLVQAFSTTIFVIDPNTNLNLKPLLIVEPASPNSTISIDEIRELTKTTSTKQSSNLFLLIKYAEKLTEKAGNSLLKTIEEPGNHIHIIFFTMQPSLLLPTIRSRSMLFRLRQKNTLLSPPNTDPEVLDYAKKLLVANTSALISLTEDLAKKKSKKTENISELDKDFFLKVLEVTIEIAYKSYFKTKNHLFLNKINGLIAAHDAILKNGNKKLHLIANLL